MRIALYLVALVIVAVLIVVAGDELASATTYGSACSVSEAHARVHRAEARLAEARRVLSATRGYNALYGAGVARWVWLSRQVGWPWAQVPTLMMVVSRESGGNPAAKNPCSTASGLLQFLQDWWYGKWDPFNPRSNLRAGYRAWTKVGWQPWAVY